MNRKEEDLKEGGGPKGRRKTRKKEEDLKERNGPMGRRRTRRK